MDQLEHCIVKATSEADANNKLQAAAAEGWALQQMTGTDNGGLFMYMTRGASARPKPAPAPPSAPPEKPPLFQGGTKTG